MTIFTMSLFGCQFIKKQISTQKPDVEDLSLDSLTNQNRQIKSAIVLLENGQTATAVEFIDEVLVANPVHKTARFLKRQLDFKKSHLNDWFGTQRLTTYDIKKNDSLASLAEFWLGNPLYFVTLAKLNNIQNPLKIQPGLKIQIPVLESSELVKSERRLSSKNLTILQKALKEKQFIQGLKKADQLFFIPEDRQKQLLLQQALLETYASSAASINEREIMIKKISQMQNSLKDQQQINKYREFINQQKKELYLDQAMLLFDDKSYVEAAGKLALITELEKENQQDSLPSIIEKPLLDKLHEEAIVLYSNHQLKRALAYWRLILGVQPENSIAKKYIQRTETLLEKLEQN